MSTRSSRRKPATEEVAEVPSKQPKLAKETVNKAEDVKEKTVSTSNENDPPKAAAKETAKADANDEAAAEEAQGEKLVFRILHCTS